MYNWRKMSKGQQQEVLQLRGQHGWPAHSPPHFNSDGWTHYHLSAACFEHVPIIGQTAGRIMSFSALLCSVLGQTGDTVFAWCVLPNHWHALVGTNDLKRVLKRIAQMHGKSSFEWNGDDHARGRQCWHCCSDRRIRSENHFHATRNYIHHNPVKHGYVKKWDDWALSSARDYLDTVGKEEALSFWREYPILGMGDKWDV